MEDQKQTTGAPNSNTGNGRVAVISSNDDTLTMEQVANSAVGKEIEARYLNLLRMFQAYKGFHDDVLDILMHSPTILKEPRYSHEQAIRKILDKIENV